MARSASSRDQPPVQTRAWTPWVTAMETPLLSVGGGTVVPPAPSAQLGQQSLVALLEGVDLRGIGVDDLGRAYCPAGRRGERAAGPGGGGQQRGAEGAGGLRRAGDRAAEHA